MNITPRGQFKSAIATGDYPDDKMNQIRELLFGEFERLNNAKVGELEARVKELELGLHQRIDGLQSRLDALAAEVTKDQRAAFDDLARGISELGERVRRSQHRDPT